MSIDFNNAPAQATLEDAEARKSRVLNAIQSDIKGFIQYLYPRATIRSDARVGDVMGEPGSSLSICVTGDAAGRWHDHATGDKGDAFSLWALVHRLDIRREFGNVLSECDAWANGTPPVHANVRHEIEASKPPGKSVNKRETAAFTYHAADGEVLFDVVRLDLFGDDGNPIIKSGGKPAKEYMPRKPDGRWGYPPGKRPLYRLPDINEADDVVFCEGEKCADAVHLCGWSATTAPGGSNTRLDAIDWRPLAGRNVILWPDNDDAGRDHMERVSEILTSIGCNVVTLSLPEGVPAKWDAADATEDQILALLREAPESAPKPRARFLTLTELSKLPPPTWMIESYLTDNSFSVIYGPSGEFKTFIVLDMALSVACGVDWRGLKVAQGSVAFVAGEGASGLFKRAYSWLVARGEGRTDAPFYTLDHSVPVTEGEALDALIAGLEDLPEMPKLIVLDTLARNFGFGDENSTQDMNRFVSAIDALRARTGAHICAIHHTGKDSDKGARGSSVLRAAIDTEIGVKRSEGTKNVTVAVTKQKEADEAEHKHFEMIPVEAVHPITGEVIGSLIPRLISELPKDNENASQSFRLGRNERRIIGYIEQCCEAQFGLMAEHLGINTGNLSRALKSLQNKGLIVKEGDDPGFYRLSPPNDSNDSE